MADTFEQLGDFLRSRRQRLTPMQVGLPDTRRRRTPGLRREEVACLAGISIEWYVKLEQGRAVTPSSSTIDALALALRLTKTEQSHLRVLAGGGHHETFVIEQVPETLKRLVTSIPCPAYVTGLRWDLLAWNKSAAALFGDLEHLADTDRNILHFMLTNPKARTLFGEHWTDEAQRMVSLFRSTHDMMADDPAFIELVGRISACCPEFDTWWNRHDVAAPISGTKCLQHPKLGRLEFDYTTLQANDDPRLKLIIYMPR